MHCVPPQLFERQEIKEEGEEASLCSYRVAQEGLPHLLPHISKQRVVLGTPEFLTLLRDRVLLMPNSLQLTSPEGGAEDKAAAAGMCVFACLLGKLGLCCVAGACCVWLLPCCDEWQLCVSGCWAAGHAW